MATPTRTHRKLRGSPEVVAKKSLTAYAHFGSITVSSLPPSPKARPQLPLIPQPQRDVSAPSRMHQVSLHVTPIATLDDANFLDLNLSCESQFQILYQTPQVQNLQVMDIPLQARELPGSGFQNIVPDTCMMTSISLCGTTRRMTIEHQLMHQTRFSRSTTPSPLNISGPSSLFPHSTRRKTYLSPLATQ